MALASGLVTAVDDQEQVAAYLSNATPTLLPPTIDRHRKQPGGRLNHRNRPFVLGWSNRLGLPPFATFDTTPSNAPPALPGPRGAGPESSGTRLGALGEDSHGNLLRQGAPLDQAETRARALKGRDIQGVGRSPEWTVSPLTPRTRARSRTV
jgi:hypothetical protein